MMDSIKIIGISAYYHDSAVCLIVDGHIIYAAQEERFSRIKNDASFPILALKDCLSFANLSLSEINAVVYYEKPFLKFERILNTFIINAPKGLFAFIQAMHIWTKDKLFIKQNIYSALKEADPTFNRAKVKLLFCEHHLSHASSAFFPSPFTEAAILTTDGVGEYSTTSLAYGYNNKIKIHKEIHFPHSIGLLYSSATYYLGFKVNSDEYKVMGLAGYGNPTSEETKKYISIIESALIRLNEDGSYHLHTDNFTFHYKLTMVDDSNWERLFGLKKRNESDELTQQHCNLAYAFQKITEKAVLNLCHEIKQITKSENLSLAGGVALNSVINGIIKDNNIFKNLFIQPASGDAGGALGCALAAHYIYYEKEREPVFPDAMQAGLLGNSFSEEETKKIIQKYPSHQSYSTEEELCKKTAELLAAGKVIGWFQGRMEFGPRALGNRSILADARNPDMQLHLNLKIKNRESFRPFAPAVLEEDACHYFDMKDTSPYMLQVHNIRKEIRLPVQEKYKELPLKDKLYTIKSTVPAVTHVDFTARIQTVNKEQHPLFYKLLMAFKQQTGCSMLINTSFNIKDEPIVCSPEDAYRCFEKTDIDILVLNKTILFKQPF